MDDTQRARRVPTKTFMVGHRKAGTRYWRVEVGPGAPPARHPDAEEERVKVQRGRDGIFSRLPRWYRL